MVRRELYTRPGDIFSYENFENTYRVLANMGHFEQTTINYDMKPDPANGTVDLDWQLESKGNDQVELSMGWGQTGLIGRIALKFTNFSICSTGVTTAVCCCLRVTDRPCHSAVRPTVSSTIPTAYHSLSRGLEANVPILCR